MFSTFRHRIELQEFTRDQNMNNGAIIKNWGTLGFVYCSIDPYTGTEKLTPDQILPEVTTIIKMRWSPLTERLTAAHRAKHKGTYFNFVRVLYPKLDRREIWILAKSGVNNG